MNTPEKPDYGEPWSLTTTGSTYDRNNALVTGDDAKLRFIICVNALAGVPDPAAELGRLRRLDWTPVTERMPERDDVNEFEDVEWSDGKDIWQCHFTDNEGATHWRPITLP